MKFSFREPQTQCNRYFIFLGASHIRNDSTRDYEGLNMNDRVNTTNASSVYTTIARNCNKNSGRDIVDSTVWRLRAIGCSSLEKKDTLFSKLYSFSTKRNKNVLIVRIYIVYLCGGTMAGKYTEELKCIQQLFWKTYGI